MSIAREVCLTGAAHGSKCQSGHENITDASSAAHLLRRPKMHEKSTERHWTAHNMLYKVNTLTGFTLNQRLFAFLNFMLVESLESQSTSTKYFNMKNLSKDGNCYMYLIQMSPCNRQMNKQGFHIRSKAISTILHEGWYD